MPASVHRRHQSRRNLSTTILTFGAALSRRHEPLLLQTRLVLLRKELRHGNSRFPPKSSLTTTGGSFILVVLILFSFAISPPPPKSRAESSAPALLVGLPILFAASTDAVQPLLPPVRQRLNDLTLPARSASAVSDPFSHLSCKINRQHVLPFSLTEMIMLPLFRQFFYNVPILPEFSLAFAQCLFPRQGLGISVAGTALSAISAQGPHARTFASPIYCCRCLTPVPVVCQRQPSQSACWNVKPIVRRGRRKYAFLRRLDVGFF